MAKTLLLQSICAVVLLAAVPALAQTATKPEAMGAGGALNNPVGTPNGATTMTPPDKMGSSSSGMMGTEPHGGMKHSGMMGHSSMHAKGDASENSMADQLNDQSYRAARSGQAYAVMGNTGTSSSGGGMK